MLAIIIIITINTIVTKRWQCTNYQLVTGGVFAVGLAFGSNTTPL